MTVPPRVTAGALALLVAIAFSSLQRPLRSQGASRPNIVLIQADDLGYGDLSAYGQAQFATPGLDRLAREGIRFTNYYAGSTVCAPSRAALMTGLHTGHAWIRGNGEVPLREEDVTVAMVLRDAGYRTAVIGKWGLGHARDDRAAGPEGIRLRLRLPRSPARASAVHRSPVSQRRAGGDRPRRATTSTICSRRRPTRSSRNGTRSRSSCISTTRCPTPSCARPEDSMAPQRGRFPETPLHQRRGRRAAGRSDDRRHLARLPVASRRRTRRSPR